MIIIAIIRSPPNVIAVILKDSISSVVLVQFQTLGSSIVQMLFRCCLDAWVANSQGLQTNHLNAMKTTILSPRIQALQSLRIIFTGVDVNPRVKPCPDCCSCIASVQHLQCNKIHDNPKCSMTNKCTVTTNLRQLCSQMQKPPDVFKMATAWFCQQVTSWVQLQCKIAITTDHNTNGTK